ncbi:hypothetical protein [Micromonospora robiginosa]|uniref:Bacterial Death-like domain-containing protein n=1 Tax=Micromonospora robiginosa TaxID=2749844 RepID=A0A7L6BC42_9ACTN|nr:hypothetical protein [Micromonospora ferruginea]QLQ39477.1 hypothetical protein H1D33_11965 [Micromonospora ferruginea]
MSQTPGDRLTDPDVWRAALPNEVYQGLVSWSRAQPYRWTHRRWLTDGRSGALVALVRRTPDRGTISQMIMKLLPPDAAEQETRQVGLAQQHTPESFWRRHMVPTTTKCAIPGTHWWLHLQEIAQADVGELRPLSALLDDVHFGGFCATIVHAVGDEWSDGHDPAPVTGTAVGHLGDFLAGHRDRLADFAARHGLSLDRPSDEMTLPGRPDPLPDPFGLLAGTLPVAHEEVEVFVGNGHGDLHPGNVFVPVRDQVYAADFRLIDLGRFSPVTPVSRDPVKLLLSVAAAWLPALVPGSSLRSTLAELVVTPQRHPAAPPMAGYLTVARQIHEAAAGWSRRRGLEPEWTRQHLLLLVGSALRTVADEALPLDDRWWFLQVAALATRAYGESFGPETAHPVTPPTRAVAVPAEPLAARRPSPGTSARLDTPARPAPAGYPGWVKVQFCRRLGTSWAELADSLDVPPYERSRFAAGSEGRELWEWLQVRHLLPALPPALALIGRDDLVELLAAPGPE